MVIKTNQLMTYTAKAAVCSEIRIEHSTHSEHHVEFLNINPLNAELNPICHLLALLGGTTIVVVSRLRVKPGDT